jgi:hypothetical protein
VKINNNFFYYDLIEHFLHSGFPKFGLSNALVFIDNKCSCGGSYRFLSKQTSVLKKVKIDLRDLKTPGYFGESIKQLISLNSLEMVIERQEPL